MNLVSVIIPTYNRAHLIADSINSILKQSYQDCEVIVVDDGSTDQTPEVLKKYKDKILYIRQENMGAGAARNRGLVEARGKYIAFLDSDDIWLDFKLELQVAVMEKMPEIGFLSTEFCIVRDSGKKINSALRTWHSKMKPWEEVYENSIRYSDLNIALVLPRKDFSIYIGNLYYPLLKNPYVLPSSAIVRSECVKLDIKFTEGTPVYEDWEFFARLARTNVSAFLDIETAINRGHVDEVRLTQYSSKTKAENRLGLIERVWKADIDFMEKYKKEVKEIEGEQMIILAKCLLLESKPEIALRHIACWKKLGLSNGKFKVLFFKIFAYLPGGYRVLLIMRYIRRVFLSLKETITKYPMLDKVTKKLREVGFWGALKIIVNNLVIALQKLSPSFRKKLKEENTFDANLEVETTDKVEVCDLDVSEERRKHCDCYQPTRVWLFNEIFNGLQIPHKDYILVDFGSGKGRVLLLAAMYPFKKIIGVEISRQLHEIAVKNIQSYNKELQLCHDISSRCLDAENFKIPDDNIVLYFYNPFDEYVMRQVLSNIEASFRRYHRNMILIYTNPIHHELIDQFDFLQIIKKNKRYCVYIEKDNNRNYSK